MWLVEARATFRYAPALALLGVLMAVPGRNMKGSIRKRGDTFTAYWFTTEPGTGKRRQHSKGGFNRGDRGDHLGTTPPASS